MRFSDSMLRPLRLRSGVADPCAPLGPTLNGGCEAWRRENVGSAQSGEE